MAKHWLQIDATLNPFISEHPSITYRRTKSIKDHNEFTGEFRNDPCKHPGTYKCRGCLYCQYMNTDTNFRLPNGRTYRPLHFANCKTIGVVYLLSCPCGCFYKGKTKLEFHNRIYKHVLSMKTSDLDLPMGSLVRDVHQGKFPRIKFLVLDRFHPNARGG